MTTTVLQDRLSLREVADTLRVDISTVGRWCRTGVNGRTLNSFVLGGRRFVLRGELEAFVGVAIPSTNNLEVQR